MKMQELVNGTEHIGICLHRLNEIRRQCTHLTAMIATPSIQEVFTGDELKALSLATQTIQELESQVFRQMHKRDVTLISAVLDDSKDNDVTMLQLLGMEEISFSTYRKCADKMIIAGQKR